MRRVIEDRRCSVRCWQALGLWQYRCASVLCGAKSRTTQRLASPAMIVEQTIKERTELWGAIERRDARDAGIAVRKKERSFTHPAWLKQQLLHDLREAQE
eukprot:COSAG02_NODE_32_length_50374_cov_46.674013_27_plen_100_part_00